MKRTVLVVNFALALLTGCDEDGRMVRTVGGSLPACTHATRAIVLPDALKKFPLPDGAVIDKSVVDAHGNAAFGGYIRGDIEAVREYYDDELPKHGYKLGAGESSEDVADREFSGHGVTGMLTLRVIPGCDDALTLQVGLL